MFYGKSVPTIFKRKEKIKIAKKAINLLKKLIKNIKIKHFLQQLIHFFEEKKLFQVNNVGQSPTIIIQIPNSICT